MTESIFGKKNCLTEFEFSVWPMSFLMSLRGRRPTPLYPCCSVYIVMSLQSHAHFLRTQSDLKGSIKNTLVNALGLHSPIHPEAYCIMKIIRMTLTAALTLTGKPNCTIGSFLAHFFLAPALHVCTLKITKSQ